MSLVWCCCAAVLIFVVSNFVVIMEREVQELRDLVAYLRVNNERLQQTQASSSAQSSPVAAALAAPSTSSLPVAERQIFLPRDRTCPIFRGRTGIGLSGWRRCKRV